MSHHLTRRTMLSAGSAAVCGLTGCITDLNPGSGDTESGIEKEQNWPMHRYNPANTGVNTDARAPESEVELSWTYETDERTGVPAVVSDTVYLKGSNQIFAVDLTDETERWSVEVDSVGLRSVAVIDDTVYVPTFDGILSLNANTGSENWSTQEVGATSPLIIDGTVYAGSSSLFAFDAATGDRRWEMPVEAQATISTTPAFADGSLFVGTAEGGDNGAGSIRAIDTETGDEQWRVQTGPIRFSSPGIRNETVIVPDNKGTIYALATKDGTKRWSVEISESLTCPPTISDETVYIGSQDGTLYALNLETGDQRWSSDGLGFVNAGATVADGTVYIGTPNGLFAFNNSSGEERWSIQTDMNLSGVVVADGAIYAGGYKNTQETPTREYTGQLHVFTT